MSIPINRSITPSGAETIPWTCLASIFGALVLGTAGALAVNRSCKSGTFIGRQHTTLRASIGVLGFLIMVLSPVVGVSTSCNDHKDAIYCVYVFVGRILLWTSWDTLRAPVHLLSTRGMFSLFLRFLDSLVVCTAVKMFSNILFNAEGESPYASYTPILTASLFWANRWLGGSYTIRRARGYQARLALIAVTCLPFCLMFSDLVEVGRGMLMKVYRDRKYKSHVGSFSGNRTGAFRFQEHI